MIKKRSSEILADTGKLFWGKLSLAKFVLDFSEHVVLK